LRTDSRARNLARGGSLGFGRALGGLFCVRVSAETRGDGVFEPHSRPSSNTHRRTRRVARDFFFASSGRHIHGVTRGRATLERARRFERGRRRAARRARARREGVASRGATSTRARSSAAAWRARAERRGDARASARECAKTSDE